MKSYVMLSSITREHLRDSVHIFKNILLAIMYRDFKLDHKNTVEDLEWAKSLAWDRTMVGPRDTV